MPTCSAEYLSRIAQQILEAVGSPEDLAAIVAESLVGANLAGHDSHGVIRLDGYVRLVRAGKVLPTARTQIARRHGATAVVDGALGWGQPAARLATQTAAEIAEDLGVGAVTIGACNHIGRVGEYVERIAARGLIGIALCNAGSAVTPYGGARRTMGTNPFACAIPCGPDRDPVVIDFATSIVAEGKLKMARAKGEQVPQGLILDSAGYPATDPSAFYNGGMLLPFGGHKGYALSVMIELLGGALSGNAPAPLPEYPGGNGVLIMALGITPFIAPDQLIDQARRLGDYLHATPPAPGSTEVLVPGEPEVRARRQRQANGIPLPDSVWADIQALAGDLGVTLEPQTH